MAKLTLREAREQLYDAVVPNLDTQEHIDTFNTYLNWAQERLINSGKWVGMVIPVVFELDPLLDPFQRHITLPPRFLSVLACKIRTQNENNCGGGGVNVKILNQWFTYLNPGPFCFDFQLWYNYGYQPFGPFARDQGDGFVTFRDSPYARYYLRFGLESLEDDGGTVLIKGFDDTGERIFTPSSSYAYEGVEFQVSYPYTQSTQIFTKDIYFYGKPPSEGYFYLDAVDVDTGGVTRIGHYWPSEVNSCLHRYNIGKICQQDTTIVETLCKLRYMPALSDNDEIWPANVGALRLTLAALKFEKEIDPNRYEDYFNRALHLLNDEVRETRGAAPFRLNISGDSFRFGSLYPGR